MPPLRRSNCLSIIVVVVATFCVGAGAQLLPSSTASSATGDITGVHDSSNSTSTSQTECEYQGTVPPASGKCRGPGERAEVRLAAAEEITGCPQNQVPYYVDGVKTKLKVLFFFLIPHPPREELLTACCCSSLRTHCGLECGECVPGTSGTEDTSLTCGLNEYCTDEGRCAPSKTSPLYGAPCPWEQGLASGLGWCGPGLRCVQHVCRICVEGSVDHMDGKRCINDEWTYSRWKALPLDPTALFLMLNFVCLCLLAIYLVLRKTPVMKWLRKKLRRAWDKGKLLPRAFRSRMPPDSEDSKPPRVPKRALQNSE
jgi:hypothetical protein